MRDIPAKAEPSLTPPIWVEPACGGQLTERPRGRSHLHRIYRCFSTGLFQRIMSLRCLYQSGQNPLPQSSECWVAFYAQFSPGSKPPRFGSCKIQQNFKAKDFCHTQLIICSLDPLRTARQATERIHQAGQSYFLHKYSPWSRETLSLRRTSKSMGLLLSWRPTSPPLTSILWPLFFWTAMASPRMVFTSLSD